MRNNHSARPNQFPWIKNTLRVGLCAAILFLALNVSSRADAAGNPQAEIIGSIVLQSGDAYISYDEAAHTWEIGTNGIRRRMRYDPATGYRKIGLTNKLTSREWLAAGGATSIDLRMELDGQTITSASREFTLQRYATAQNADGSIELVVSLARGALIAHLHYAVFPGTGIIEQWVAVENTGATVLPNLTALDSFSVYLRPSADALTLYWVQGLSPTDVSAGDTQVPTLRLRSLKLAEGVTQDLGSQGRSSQDDMGWFALSANGLKEGLFAGIEWSGAWQVRVARANGRTSLQGGLDGFRHDLAPGETFEAPRRFMGFYKGDLDDAANASHEFARRYLLRPRPANFPWTQYNTWFAYYTNLNETTLRREVDIAAELGLEVFYVDAGWYVGSPNRGDFSFGLGTWRENRDKFPNGLAAFADYVHSKGMKFGLWVEPERVDLAYAGPGTEISLDWISPVTDLKAVPPPGEARVAQICFGHPEAREWAKDWLSRVIREYKLDWLKWDNNLWMPCDLPGQPGDQNYAHVQGLYEIIDYLRQEFPNLIIENCASGGNRMDYALMRRTDIAWLSDQTEPSYRVRYHVTGASYPFPPEYLNSWLVESFFEHMAAGEKDLPQLQAWLRSRMMGAFGISTKMVGWSADARAVVAQEIAQYKTMRSVIARGKIYRLLPQTELDANLDPPEEPDAAEFYDSSSDAGVIFLFQGKQPWTTRRLIPKGLTPKTNYQVTSDDRAISLRRTGRQLSAQGITFRYDGNHPSTVVYIQPAAVMSPP